MNWLIDIALVAIVGVATFVGYKRGVIKMLLSFLVIVMALCISFFVSEPLAEASYDWFFVDTVDQTLEASLENSTQDSVNKEVQSFLENDLSMNGLEGLLEFNAEKVSGLVDDTPLEEVGDTIKEQIIRPPMVVLLRCLIFVVLFFILWIILSLVSKIVYKTTGLADVRGVNAYLGGGVGLVVGILLCVAVVLLLDLTIQLNPFRDSGITQEMKDQTILYQLLSKILHS